MALATAPRIARKPSPPKRALSQHPAPRVHDPLAQARVAFSLIRHTADTAILFEINRINERHPDLSQSHRQRLMADSCRPHRLTESKALRSLAAGLTSKDLARLFDETLDPHFLPDELTAKLPKDGVHLLAE
jgi:hypothetical protein